MDFDYDKIMKPNVVVHCTTEEEAVSLLKWAHNQGLRWCNGGYYIEFYGWRYFKELACYDLYNGETDSRTNYYSNNYIIYSFEEVILKEKVKIKVKNKKRKVKFLNKNVKRNLKESKNSELEEKVINKKPTL